MILQFCLLEISETGFWSVFICIALSEPLKLIRTAKFVRGPEEAHYNTDKNQFPKYLIDKIAESYLQKQTKISKQSFNQPSDNTNRIYFRLS